MLDHNSLVITGVHQGVLSVIWETIVSHAICYF